MIILNHMIIPNHMIILKYMIILNHMIIPKITLQFSGSRRPHVTGDTEVKTAGIPVRTVVAGCGSSIDHSRRCGDLAVQDPLCGRA